MDYSESIKAILESLLLATSEPISIERFIKVIGADGPDIEKAIDELEAEYAAAKRGFRIRQVAGGYGLYTNPDYSFYVDRLLQGTTPRRLSRAALEVLAIVIFKQPITRAQINNIRGVSSETVINSLVEKGLIAEKGRDKTAGMPILYETTPCFLEALGLNSIEELPELIEFAPDQETIDQIREQLTSQLPTESVPDQKATDFSSKSG
jgi:segregation and condensation protein B